MGKDGSGSGFSRMAEVEEFHKSISDLISTTLTEGAKVPGGHGVALTSNILQLVPCLPLNPVLMPCIDPPSEKDVQDYFGRDAEIHPNKSWCPEFTFNWGNEYLHACQ